MRFNLLYQYLSKQVYKPTVKAKCRVYMAKDLRSYQKRYKQLMHQLAGSYWDPLLQKIAYDNMLIKKVAKAFAIGALVLMTIYVII